MNKKPFFVRFLESEKAAELPVAAPEQAGARTLKYPSDSDESAVTLKYPSDGDEGYTV